MQGAREGGAGECGAAGAHRALGETSAAPHSAQGSWEQGAAWEHRSLAPRLHQHVSTRGTCETQLLPLAREAGSDSGELVVADSFESTIALREAVRRLSATRQQLRQLWHDLQEDTQDGPVCSVAESPEQGTPVLLTPPQVKMLRNTGNTVANGA